MNLDYGKPFWALTEMNPNMQGGGVSLAFDSIQSFEITGEADAPSEPIEQGEFSAYNKVTKPREIRCTLSRQGSREVLQDFLDTFERWRTGTILIDVMTPENFYPDFTLTSYNYSQTAEKGIGVLDVDLVLKEIKQVEQQYTSIRAIDTRDPQHADTIDRGQVQTERVSVLKKAKTAVDDSFGG